MKEPIVQTWDDLELRECNTRIPASVTVVFGYQGEYYEIDLTENHARDFADFMQRYIRASNKIDGMPKIRKPSSRKSNTYYQDMRRFADEKGDPKLMYRQEPDGKFFYPAALRQAYEEHYQSVYS